MSQSGPVRISSGGGGGGNVDTLKGNSGGYVGPDGVNNINVIGDGTTIDVVGHPGTNTLIISALGDVAITFTEDDTNVATPSGGNINVFGGANINTAAPGSASTIQINLNNSILLPATTAPNSGVIALGASLNADRFLHNYGILNTFVGEGSGNFTLTGSSNVGVGTASLSVLTNGSGNVGIGSQSLFNLTSGTTNFALGGGSLFSLTLGSRNIAIGFQAGQNYTSTESNNILIGNDGVLADNNTIRIGTQGNGSGEQNTTYIAGIYNTAFGATNQVVFIDDNGKLGSSKGDNGEIIIGSTAGSPAWANITSADNSVTITNGANSIDLSTNGGVLYTVTTNNAVLTPIFTTTVANNTAVSITAVIAGAKSDFSASFWASVTFGVRRSGGGAIRVDIPNINPGDDSVAAPAVQANVSGNNAIIYVQGVVAETWNWKATVTKLIQS